MENTLTHILLLLLGLFFIFILLWKNAIFIHCNFFCQEYKFTYTYLLTYVKANKKQIKDLVAVSYKFLSEVPSKLEIQCKKGNVKWGDFDDGCYFINTNTLPSYSSIFRLNL